MIHSVPLHSIYCKMYVDDLIIIMHFISGMGEEK